MPVECSPCEDEVLVNGCPGCQSTCEDCSFCNREIGECVLYTADTMGCTGTALPDLDVERCICVCGLDEELCDVDGKVFNAEDCTLPPDRPLLILRESIGLIL